MPGRAAGIARIVAFIHADQQHMMELNPVRQRIADLKGRLDALRGFL